MATLCKTYSPKLKAETVREIWRETRSISQIATQYGIHPNQLYAWRDRAAGLPDLFTDTAPQTLAEQAAAHAAEVEQLYAQIGRLTT
jgi:transposase